VYGFISGNEKGSKPFIIANKDSVANRKMMGWEELKEETKLWFKETIPSGQTYTYNYSYTQASYSAAATNHVWSLSPTL